MNPGQGSFEPLYLSRKHRILRADSRESRRTGHVALGDLVEPQVGICYWLGGNITVRKRSRTTSSSLSKAGTFFGVLGNGRSSNARSRRLNAFLKRKRKVEIRPSTVPGAGVRFAEGGPDNSAIRLHVAAPETCRNVPQTLAQRRCSHEWF
jgi:hypothetical protein